MSERPDLAVMWNLHFDDHHRIRPEVRGAVAREFRCQRRGRHLQAVVFRSKYGGWVSYRPMRGARDVWAQEWLDRAPDSIEVTCHCDQNHYIDLVALRSVR